MDRESQATCTKRSRSSDSHRLRNLVYLARKARSKPTPALQNGYFNDAFGICRRTGSQSLSQPITADTAAFIEGAFSHHVQRISFDLFGHASRHSPILSLALPRASTGNVLGKDCFTPPDLFELRQ